MGDSPESQITLAEQQGQGRFNLKIFLLRVNDYVMAFVFNY